ncbi:hypothetical protein [Halobacillus litoralis]|uniref:hypothetical protein n=1 Tax=Halobacillus litoralis TaxID=45668 RepID=UPI001CD2623A|nr:hypothetical protein [Halobacillus litoralis]MCA1024273.1 hypothetical protein [Halobacillus litoralis]
MWFSPDAWLAFAGTIIGAGVGTGVAGYVTLRSVKKQLEYDKLQRDKDEIEKYLKGCDAFLNHAVNNLRANENLLGTLKQRLTESKQNPGVLSKESVDRNSSNVKNINDSTDFFSFPIEVYSQYKTIKRCVDFTTQIRKDVLEYFDNILLNDDETTFIRTTLIEELEETIVKLKFNLDEVKEYNENKEEELKNINKKLERNRLISHS